ncbi:hypothetical protein ACFLYF_00575 [Chloroflexota bacterium]
MAKLRKSWWKKLADSNGLPRVGEIDGKMSKRWGTGTVCIPAPIEVDEIMRHGPVMKKPPVAGVILPPAGGR